MSQEKVNKKKLFEKIRHKYVLHEFSIENSKRFFGGGRKKKRKRGKFKKYK